MVKNLVIEFHTKLRLLITNNFSNLIINKIHLKVQKTRLRNLIFKCSKNKKIMNRKK